MNKKNKKLVVVVLVVVIIGLAAWYFMRPKNGDTEDDSQLRLVNGNGNGAPIPPVDPATPTSSNPCDNMDGRKPGGHRWKCAEGRRRGLVIPSSANLRGYPEGNILAWMYHIKYESSWANKDSMSMKDLAEAASYQRMKQLGDG